MRSFSQAPLETGFSSQKASGEKVLLKALAVFINPEGNKKTPVKNINIFSSGSPLE